ncbi:MAG: DEAD/DEAH box helicase [Planctomycetota bacterium]
MPHRQPKDFLGFGLHPSILEGIRTMGYEVPTPIQAQAIPAVMSGRDLIGSAQTGTGKTAAFLLPILHRLMGAPRTGGSRVLILTPTRELAMQIDEHMLGLSYYTGLTGAAVVGGLPMDGQEKALKGGVDVVVATPGRLLDHFSHSSPRFETLEVLVLDEADRMLDMGFLPSIESILFRLPKKRQTLFFSATMPPQIQKLVGEIVSDPVHIRVGPTAPPKEITHRLFPVAPHRKLALILEMLRRFPMPSVLVFCGTKRGAEQLGREILRRGIKAGVIHADRTQEQRMRSLEGFRQGVTPILVATDVASRGIDVEGITHVLNYDVPRDADSYIHRVGRTARANAVGEAITFVTGSEERDVGAIERVLGHPIQRVFLPGFDSGASPGVYRGDHMEPRRRDGGHGDHRSRGGPQHHR